MSQYANLGCELCAAVISGFSKKSGETAEQLPSGLHDKEDLHISCKAVKLEGASYQFLPLSPSIGSWDDENFNPKLGENIPRSSRSPACFEMISRWVKGCRDNHETCNRDRGRYSLMPTRVLDIGDLSAPPRILITNGEIGEYATLSYCWGKGSQSITTTHNLEQRQKVLHLTILPPVFQDAITVARKLGQKYLWIDSLCILQSSTHDWNVESMKMQQYYMGSSLNIIAAAAKNPTCGIFDSANLIRRAFNYVSLERNDFVFGPDRENFVENGHGLFKRKFSHHVAYYTQKTAFTGFATKNQSGSFALLSQRSTGGVYTVLRG
ncbi:heterokaryon incompatibility protein-domain-containing protein [Halenospora varia]|nr:heterokaryon incompatibility protein-domain-containing protein [Halenospora varia]